MIVVELYFDTGRNTKEDVRIYVEIEPSYGWRPWPGRWSRWWWELHFQRPVDDAAYTCAYTDGGSGGTFTFRKAMQKADAVVWDYWRNGDWKDAEPVKLSP